MRRWLLCTLAVLLAMACASQVEAQSGGRAYYDLGVFAYEEGAFKEAEAHLQKALAFDPGEASANHYMGKTLLAQERYPEALKYLNTAWKKNPELPGLKYDRAYAYYKTGEYGKGADLFKEVVQKEPDYILANYYGGVCLYRKGSYQEANTYLMSSAEKSPDLKVRSYYYSGLSHYYLGQDEEAIQKLTYVRETTDSDDVKANAGKWLDRIQRGERAGKPYKLTAKLAFAYDDNVPLEPRNQNDLFSDESDTVLLGYVYGSYNVVNKSNLELGAAASRAQSWYTDLDEFNTSETTGQLYGYYYTEPYSFGLSFRPVLYQVDGEDFLLVYQATPLIAYQFSEEWTGRFTYTYSANDYRQDGYEDRDGSTHEVYLDAFYNLRDDRGYVVGGAGYESNTASEDEFDYGKIKARLAASIEMGWGLRGGLMLAYSNKAYSNEDPFQGKKRKDSQIEGTVSLSRSIVYSWLRLAAEYSYTDNASNIEDYEYTRQVVGAALVADF